MVHSQNRTPGETSEADAATSSSQTESRGALATAWNALCAAIGAVMGLLPHVLHHVGLLAGAALVTEVGGNLLFGAVGLLLSIPLLRRLYRRFGGWEAPAIAMALFTMMFALSAFVIGPAISDDSGQPDVPTRRPSPSQHDSHHNG